MTFKIPYEFTYLTQKEKKQWWKNLLISGNAFIHCKLDQSKPEGFSVELIANEDIILKGRSCPTMKNL